MSAISEDTWLVTGGLGINGVPTSYTSMLKIFEIGPIVTVR
jgi:hypothetical protein